MYKICQWATYILCVVGWGMVLYGRMHGLEGISEP
jgi:hypothetical protein